LDYLDYFAATKSKGKRFVVWREVYLEAPILGRRFALPQPRDRGLPARGCGEILEKLAGKLPALLGLDS
jgi:hypothetical protein